MTVEVNRVYGSVTGALVQFDVVCPRHGTWVFPPGSVAMQAFAEEHDGCVAVPAELQRRRGRSVRKSRRSPLLHVVPAPAASSPDVAGKSAPAHLGVTLGFAPQPVRGRGRPGTVRL